MKDLVEAVAAALSEYGAPNFPFDEYGEDYREARRKQARVAIEAMRKFVAEQDAPKPTDDGEVQVSRASHYSA